MVTDMILTVTANAAIDTRYVIEKMEIAQVNRAKTVQRSAGGKGLNVSRAAHIAGEEIVATGFLGGHSGEFIQESLQAEGIREEFVWCNGETRTCINFWDEAEGTQTEILEPGFDVTQINQDALIAKFTELVHDADVATISGSLPGGCTSDLYRRMIDAATAAGKKILVDTSGQTLIDVAGFKPFMIKPNIDEIQQILGRELKAENREELITAAEELHAMGIPTVVISLGSAGSFMSCQDGVYEAHVPKIDAVNTVGCGDSMTGGFAVGIARGLSMPECLKLASAISTASAMTDRTGFFRPEEMEQIKEQVEIVKIK